jgi:hypothetical protein
MIFSIAVPEGNGDPQQHTMRHCSGVLHTPEPKPVVSPEGTHKLQSEASHAPVPGILHLESLAVTVRITSRPTVSDVTQLTTGQC